MVRHQSFKNAFGRLAACYTFSNSGILFIFMVCRFIAITFPIYYRKMFTLHASNVIIAFFATASFLYSSPRVFFSDGCDFFYIHSPPGWTYNMTPCTEFLALYVDYYYNYFIFFVSLALDIITILQLRSMRRHIKTKRTELLLNIQVDQVRRHGVDQDEKPLLTAPLFKAGEKLFSGTCDSKSVGCIRDLVNTHLAMNADLFEGVTTSIRHMYVRIVPIQPALATFAPTTNIKEEEEVEAF
ncbi:unnamed protein product [Haemonchus placei]|uniref:7TM_GPCR_Srx domain-containing protein n=1 Tax=Haemonchus placei TaxID=6290 RepID=A0A0N4X7E7_HAEPC|nr:unnamed protein product [Haemonchus placei]